jgi:hypothetical protein
MASKYRFGRTQAKGPSLIERIKNFKPEDLKNLRWSQLTPKQRKQVVGGGITLLVLMLAVGALSKNDAEMYSDNVNDFVHASAAYDVTATAKTTTSSAHQLIVGQAQKIKTAKSKNYTTDVENIETKVVSQKGNSIIGTSRVNTVEKMGNSEPKHFTHLFVFQGQKVGAGWKIGNMLEAEAKVKTVDAN